MKQTTFAVKEEDHEHDFALSINLAIRQAPAHTHHGGAE
jgi:hypothetical protein